MNSGKMKPKFFEIEELFVPVASTVSDFVDKHGMRLKKCPRGNSGWELIREHPEGGDVTLLMLYDCELGLGVGSVWSFPCVQMSLQYSHFRNLRPCPIEAAPLSAMLDEELKCILDVKFGYWTNINPLRQSNDA